MAKLERLPHHRLIAFEVATALLEAVVSAKIADPKLRDQALRAAKSTCLNIAEAAGRRSTADQARVFAIARGEATEAAAAVEIAAIAGDCTYDSAITTNLLAHRLVGLLTGLMRRKPVRGAADANPDRGPER